METLKELLDRAIVAEYGIAVKLSSPYEAKYQRRRLYAAREKLRERGLRQYDGLSLIIKHVAELWIIQRDALPGSDSVELWDCRNVSQNELPERILSRGKSRAGLFIS